MRFSAKGPQRKDSPGSWTISYKPVCESVMSWAAVPPMLLKEFFAAEIGFQLRQARHQGVSQRTAAAIAQGLSIPPALLPYLQRFREMTGLPIDDPEVQLQNGLPGGIRMPGQEVQQRPHRIASAAGTDRVSIGEQRLRQIAIFAGCGRGHGLQRLAE
jgi:hypothetical protein